MKNKIPLILLLASGAGVFFWLRRKAAAGANLRYEPIDIAIDSNRSAASLFSRIYYNIKLRLINNERANVNIRAINLQVFLKVANRQERKLGDVINNNAFQVPAQGSQEIKLETSISTGNVLQILKDALIEGLQFNIKISGYIDTDLGRVNVNFTKDFGTGNIGRPIILAGDKFTLRYKKKIQPVGSEIKQVYKYMLNSINTGARISDFEVETKSGTTIPGELFFDQAQNAPFDIDQFRAN